MSSTRLPARPPARTSKSAAGSIPERSASSAASASAAVVVPTMSWLQALASDPAPSGPMLPDGGSHRARTAARSRRKSASRSPPAMMARVPSMAPLVPPLTGASTTMALPGLPPGPGGRSPGPPPGETTAHDHHGSAGLRRVSAQLASSPAAASSMKDRSGSMKTMTGRSRRAATSPARAGRPAASKSSRRRADRFQAVTAQPGADQVRGHGQPHQPQAYKARCSVYPYAGLDLTSFVVNLGKSVQYPSRYSV